MWKDRLLQIAQEKNIYGEQINTGAAEEEIRIFIKRVEDEFEIDLPNQYIEMLRNVNGIEFNGFMFYGIDEELLDTPQNQHVEVFISLDYLLEKALSDALN